jgi:hypothetical protein
MYFNFYIIKGNAAGDIGNDTNSEIFGDRKLQSQKYNILLLVKFLMNFNFLLVKYYNVSCHNIT